MAAARWRQRIAPSPNKTPIASFCRGAGIGLRAPHWRAFLRARPQVDFLEVHPENYMMAGGLAHHVLACLRRDYPLSFHAPALAPVSRERPQAEYLARLKALIAIYQPDLVSGHLAWTSYSGRVFHDLLPLPLNEETLALAVERVGEVQEALAQKVLIENPSLYGALSGSDIPEPEFLALLAGQTGCGLLVDVNNIAVSAANLGFDPYAYIAALPLPPIGEIHLAGHAHEHTRFGAIRIDDHGSPVPQEVWQLAQALLARAGAKPLLVEWDKNLPELPLLLAEREKAARLLPPAKKRPPAAAKKHTAIHQASML